MHVYFNSTVYVMGFLFSFASSKFDLSPYNIYYNIDYMNVCVCVFFILFYFMLCVLHECFNLEELDSGVQTYTFRQACSPCLPISYFGVNHLSLGKVQQLTFFVSLIKKMCIFSYWLRELSGWSHYPQLNIKHIRGVP